MSKYHIPHHHGARNKITQGGAKVNGEISHLVFPGCEWNDGGVIFGLRESDGFHGGDYIGVFEQKESAGGFNRGSTVAKPKKFGVITYERGNGRVSGYIMFDLSEGSGFTHYYSLPQTVGIENLHDVATNEQPIDVNGFLSAVYSVRGTPASRVISGLQNAKNHLTRNGRLQQGRLKGSE